MTVCEKEKNEKTAKWKSGKAYPLKIGFFRFAAFSFEAKRNVASYRRRLFCLFSSRLPAVISVFPARVPA
jgi:hypothetical protein